jgi:thioester reductase-like protein
MAIFITGATGYVGSYVVSGLLQGHTDRLALLIRAKSIQEAEQRLWKSLQMHLGFEQFIELVRSRVDLFLGDITEPDLGLTDEDFEHLRRTTESVIHMAASLNRRSDKVCFNVNLRGTLEVIKLAQATQEYHGLRRFSDISTVAVCGKRDREMVREDESIDWSRDDYDPYARTKKFCEHMVHELLPDVPVTVFRPSVVLGDSQRAQTTQFDMVRAFVGLAHLPALPLRADGRLDVVPADYVGRAVVAIHQQARPRYGVYHLSSGAASLTYQQITDALRQRGFSVPHMYFPYLQRPFQTAVEAFTKSPKKWPVTPPSKLLKAFWPYLVFDTVFDNQRVVEELGEKPTPFGHYAYDLLRFAMDNHFTYPYRPWPEQSPASR